MATTVPRTNLNDQVYEEIRARVLTRQHAAGEKLSLHGLASELGVSRSPVHHALTRLVWGHVRSLAPGADGADGAVTSRISSLEPV